MKVHLLTIGQKTFATLIPIEDEDKALVELCVSAPKKNAILLPSHVTSPHEENAGCLTIEITPFAQS